jgi:PAS domain S-box-containing protein
MNGMPMPPELPLSITYDGWLVALSVLVASVAAYVALTFGERLTEKRGGPRTLWLLGGATAMGTGIWSMHFTGMLAFHLPIPVAYDLWIVALSIVLAIVASGIALIVVSRNTMGLGEWLMGGLLMGTGIVTMHYTGMAAMRVSARMRWDLWIVALSFLIAVVVSLIALALVFRLRALPEERFGWRRISAAIIMGIAIAGMHYTGMAAATFTASTPHPPMGIAVTAGTLAGYAIALTTILVLGLTVVGSYLDRLYSDLQHSEGFLAEGQRISHTGSWGWNVATGERAWSDETFRILGYDPDVSPTREKFLQRVHPEDAPLVQRRMDRGSRDGQGFEVEPRLLMPDGSVKYVHLVAHAVRDQRGQLEFIGAVMDVTAAKRAEEDLRRAQADLANVSRVTTLGEVAASIAHEVNQPLTAVISNAEACRRWLDVGTPNLEEVRAAVESIIKSGHRAGEITRRVRALLSKTDTPKTPLDINDVAKEAIALVQHQLSSHRVSLRMELAAALPRVNGDRIQLQQVIVNLVNNGIEAMQPVTDRPRELVIRTHQDEEHRVLVAVQDCGVGIGAENAEQLFKPFFTTKSSGMGMGLAICRSIIEAHAGRLTACSNVGPGATLQFVLPPYELVASLIVGGARHD